LLDDSEPVSKLGGEGKMNRPFLISVHPRWASAFFLSQNPKLIELRKGSFGASLQPGDTIVIYATLPEGKAISTVKVMKRESLPIDRLWRASEQRMLAKVS
jgi:predicted transcriptional regulator